LLFFTHFQIIYGLFIGLFCNWAAQQWASYQSCLLKIS
jgi:Na+/H+-dicarboxylate symporter